MVRLEDLQKTIEWLRDIESENVFYIDKNLKRELGNFINNLMKYTEQLKEDKKKAIEYIKEKIEEQKELPDYSKYYLENYDKAIQETHSSHSGILLETIKSTTIKRYEDILEMLGDKENE